MALLVNYIMSFSQGCFLVMLLLVTAVAVVDTAVVVATVVVRADLML